MCAGGVMWERCKIIEAQRVVKEVRNWPLPPLTHTKYGSCPFRPYFTILCTSIISHLTHFTLYAQLVSPRFYRCLAYNAKVKEILIQ